MQMLPGHEYILGNEKADQLARSGIGIVVFIGHKSFSSTSVNKSQNLSVKNHNQIFTEGIYVKSNKY